MEKEALADYDNQKLSRIENVINLVHQITHFEDRFLLSDPLQLPILYRKFFNIEFEGTEDSIAFASLVDNSSYEEPPRYEIGRVSYFLNDDDVLCKRRQTYAEFFQQAKMDEEEIKTV